jgi:hypothetical protein
MTTEAEVELYLKEFKTKTAVFQILFLDYRGKNEQALTLLDITPIKRKEIIEKLVLEDYSEGPLEEKMRGILPMWVFGKMVKGIEVYIKISMGVPNSNTICISFHPSEYPIKYPFKNKQQ